MRFLLDECVTSSVYELLKRKHFDVQRSIDILGQGASDRQVVEHGDSLGAIVIDANPTDFRKLVSRRPRNNRMEFRAVSRVSFCCQAPNEERQLETALPYIHFEWRRRRRVSDRRLIIEITEAAVVIFP